MARDAPQLGGGPQAELVARYFATREQERKELRARRARGEFDGLTQREREARADRDLLGPSPE